MRILIVEDEYGAAQNLLSLLDEVDGDFEVLAILETVQDVVSWVNRNESPDLAFFDIQLADGLSFEIFEKVNLSFPVIFTTAYNEYALRAFKVNSIDYLLKPINKNELGQAIHKFEQIHKAKQGPTEDNRLAGILSTLEELRNRNYKKSFLIHFKDRMIPLSVHDIHYAMIDNGRVKCFCEDGSSWIMDQTLDEIEQSVDPDEFFRANRQYLIARSAIKEVNHYFTGRLKLSLSKKTEGDIIISKGKAAAFKQWLDH
jgi:two-component system LytT family response regulator